MIERMAACFVGLALGLTPSGLLSTVSAAPCVLCGITPGEAASSGTSAPLEIEVETRLDFARVIIGGNGAGSVLIRPDGSSGSNGSAEAPSGRARIGRIVIRGEAGRDIYVDFPKSLELTGSKGSVVRVRSLFTDLGDHPRLDSRGELAIEFGGELEVQGDVDGDFRGNLLVHADYL